MTDLSYYSLLVSIKEFEPLEESVLNDYYVLPNKLDIEDLFLTLTSGVVNYGQRDLEEIIEYCNESAEKICAKYGVDANLRPIFKAYLIPVDYKPQNDLESDILVELFENMCAIQIAEDSPVWYLREGIKYRLMALYSWLPRYFFKMKALLADVKNGRDKYEQWLNKVR